MERNNTWRAGKEFVVGPVVLLGLLKVAMLFELQWHLRARLPFVCFNMSNKVMSLRVGPDCLFTQMKTDTQ